MLSELKQRYIVLSMVALAPECHLLQPADVGRAVGHGHLTRFLLFY